MTYVIVDLEATCCDAGTIPRAETKIIEIGAVACEKGSFRGLDEYQSFVRPLLHPVLTPFCRRLTCISQTDVDAADPARDVIPRFGEWFWKFTEPLFCSWGGYDRNQLQRDCHRIGISNPLPREHTNIKLGFSEKQGIAKLLGMRKALRRAGLELRGTHHRAIDDVRNMARLLPFIFGEAKIR